MLRPIGAISAFACRSSWATLIAANVRVSISPTRISSTTLVVSDDQSIRRSRFVNDRRLWHQRSSRHRDARQYADDDWSIVAQSAAMSCWPWTATSAARSASS